MNYLYSIILLLSLNLTTVFGQKATNQPNTTPKQEEMETLPNSLLWAITGKDLKDTSYLYGTIHLISKDDFFLTDETTAAFKASDKVVFEINLESMNDMMSQFSLLMKAFMNGGQTLKDLLAEEDYQEVKNHFEKKGMTSLIWNMMERIKPMFLSMFASTDISGESPLMSGDMVSYEMEFMAMAKVQKKPVDGLETAEYQMSMFDSIPYKAQAEMLLHSIRAEGGAATDNMQLDTLVTLYKNQDLQGLQNMFETDEEGIGKYEQLLLVNRNRNWIPIIEKMIAEQTTFFGVGAGHLPGKEGVINLLREAGYTLTPLSHPNSPKSKKSKAFRL